MTKVIVLYACLRMLQLSCDTLPLRRGGLLDPRCASCSSPDEVLTSNPPFDCASECVLWNGHPLPCYNRKIPQHELRTRLEEPLLPLTSYDSPLGTDIPTQEAFKHLRRGSFHDGDWTCHPLLEQEVKP